MKKTPKSHSVKISPEDEALFRAAVGGVRPLAEQNRVALRPVPRKPSPKRPAPSIALADSLSDFAADEAPDEYLGNGLSRMTLRKLRRGTWPVEDSLDLHGNRTEEARRLLQSFLQDASQRGLRCVRVIHGKGLNSKDGEAVLRKLARHWLTQHPLVLGYCDAPPREGGSGAVMVLLKSNI